ncbi:quinolinate synthase A [Andreesenia angusta]|uniref:Quinolinate synthase n=1 Tax=Andreesenia angusta TaxID=39480 RepID=A0A1S1V4K7_9FIRM|nr:quinolinate synthase NadA [Andreesenia angusta]OHW61563.1 quinolinate synthase A [Andreesenia angusta]
MKNILDEIMELKKERDAIILAHNYQIPEIQDIADVVGDSLKLSQVGKESEQRTIVLSGVRFMAESAKILSPEKTVLLPASDAGCPMADMIDIDKLRAFKAENPGVPVMCYVNSSADVKAESDICCTSANALKIARSLESDKILFVPDKCLGGYIAKMIPEKEFILYDGYCVTHNRIKREEVLKIRELYPESPILVHPECSSEIADMADFVGSTSQIISYAKNSDSREIIIGTEMGVMHKLQNDNPDKSFKLLSPSLICPNMKKTTLEDIRDALKYGREEIVLDEDIRVRAEKSLDDMLKLS